MAAGTVSEYPIGSPNSTQTAFTQPIQIQSSNNSVAGLLISESAGNQPAISATQTNSGDIADFYQAGTPEFTLKNTLLTVNPNVVFNNGLQIGASNSVGGVLQFGSATTATLQYATTSGYYPSNSFGFSAPISSLGGYGIGTTSILYLDGNNTVFNTATNSTLTLAKNGGEWGTLSPVNGFVIYGSSSYGPSASVAGNLSVAGTSSFNNLAANVLTVKNITSPTTQNLVLAAATGATVQLDDPAKDVTVLQINPNGTYTLGNITGSSTSFSVPAVLTSNITFSNGVLFDSGGGTEAYQDNTTSGAFSFVSAGNVVNVQFRDNGSGQLNSNLTYNAAGKLTANAIATGNIVGSSLNVSGNINAVDIYASRATNSGAIYLGTNQTHYLFFDTALYQMPNAGLNVGGVVSATGLAVTGNVSLPVANSIAFGTDTIADSGTQFTFSSPIQVANGASNIPNIHSSQIQVPAISSVAAMSITTPQALNISATSINVTTVGSINMGSSSYGNTSATITGQVNTPLVNTVTVQDTTGQLVLNASAGANVIHMLSNAVVLDNSQSLTTGGSSYGPSENVAGNATVSGTLYGDTPTLFHAGGAIVMVPNNGTSPINAYGSALNLLNNQAVVTGSSSYGSEGAHINGPVSITEQLTAPAATITDVNVANLTASGTVSSSSTSTNNLQANAINVYNLTVSNNVSTNSLQANSITTQTDAVNNLTAGTISGPIASVYDTNGTLHNNAKIFAMSGTLTGNPAQDAVTAPGGGSILSCIATLYDPSDANNIILAVKSISGNTCTITGKYTNSSVQPDGAGFYTTIITE